MSTITTANISVYLFVFVRMGGMILLNPIFARRNMPTQVKMGLILCLTLLIAPTVQAAPIASLTEAGLLFGLLREVFIGLVCSYVFYIFYYLLFFAGDLMDVQFGLSMAKIFDPGTSIQMSVSGNLLNIMFMLYLFATDSHLLLIRIFASSYQIIPVGAATLSFAGVAGFVLNLFLSAFSLIVRLTLPFIAAEFVIEIAMGVLMKLIPQIHVFVINIQFKMLLGIFLLLAFASPISGFVDHYLAVMFESIEKALYAMAGA